MRRLLLTHESGEKFLVPRDFVFSWQAAELGMTMGIGTPVNLSASELIAARIVDDSEDLDSEGEPEP
jgi:hypothetical protein